MFWPSTSLDWPVSRNGTVIAAAVALDFLVCDMARRSRLLAECVDQREPSRFPDVQLSRFRFFMEEFRSRGCNDGRIRRQG
jgi:hypothetical protein